MSNSIDVNKMLNFGEELAETCALDAFNHLIRLGDLVVYAGSDYKDRPTLNIGYVNKFKPGYVQVQRTHRSTRNGVETGIEHYRKIWVETWKVGKVHFQ